MSAGGEMALASGEGGVVGLPEPELEWSKVGGEVEVLFGME